MVDEVVVVQNEDICLEVMVNILFFKLIIVWNGVVSDLGLCYVFSCCFFNELYCRWFVVVQQLIVNEQKCN